MSYAGASACLTVSSVSVTNPPLPQAGNQRNYQSVADN